MTDWTELYAVHETAGEGAMLLDLPVRDEAVRRAVDRAVARLELDEVDLVPVGPASMMLVESATWAPGPAALLVVGERFFLKLRTPNPFPTIVLFGPRRMKSTLAGLRR